MRFLSNHKAALLGFAVSVAYWPGILSGGFVARWAAIAVGVPLVSTLDPRALPESMRWVLAFMVALGAISLIGSPYPMAGALDLLFIVFLCLAFVMAASLETLDDLITGIGAGLAISSFLCVMQAADIWRPVPQISLEPAGLFFNSEVLGEFSALVFVWAALRPRWMLAVIAFVPIVLTESRIAGAAAGAALIYGLRPHWRVALPLIIALIVAGIAAVLFTKLGNSAHRVTIWGATILSLSLQGNGLGWVTAAFPYEEFTHSDALQALAELGIGALALLAIPSQAMRGNRGNNAERALFVAACVEVMVSFPLHFPASGFLAAVVAGYLVGSGPCVRLGAPECGDDDGARRVRWHEARWRAFVGRGRGGEPIPVRSVFAQHSPLYARADRTDPRTAEGVR